MGALPANRIHTLQAKLPEKILDAGAGYGFLTRILLDAGFEVVAIDPNEECSQLAKQWYGVDILRQEIYDVEFPDKYFDTVILSILILNVHWKRSIGLQPVN